MRKTSSTLAWRLTTQSQTAAKAEQAETNARRRMKSLGSVVRSDMQRATLLSQVEMVGVSLRER